MAIFVYFLFGRFLCLYKNLDDWVMRILVYSILAGGGEQSNENIISVGLACSLLFISDILLIYVA